MLEESPSLEVREVKLIESVCAVEENARQATYKNKKTTGFDLVLRNGSIPVLRYDFSGWSYQSSGREEMLPERVIMFKGLIVK